MKIRYLAGMAANERNETANQILNDIHDDMKKSEENIATKKADIEKLMENLKK